MTDRLSYCGWRLLIALLVGWTMESEAVEKAAYRVVEAEDPFELRDYAAQLVAEVIVEGSLEQAGNDAFNPLFRYISGANQPSQRIAMTSPVSQQRAGEKMAMTTPVAQRPEGDRWIVQFIMPASYTLDTLPTPDNPDVALREIPAQRMAAIRYSGRWTERRFQEHLEKLQAWVETKGWVITGEPVWARYNSPFAPPFLRRNEVLLPVDALAP